MNRSALAAILLMLVAAAGAVEPAAAPAGATASKPPGAQRTAPVAPQQPADAAPPTSAADEAAATRRAGERFKPSEKISEDLSVSFPSDI